MAEARVDDLPLVDDDSLSELRPRVAAETSAADGSARDPRAKAGVAGEESSDTASSRSAAVSADSSEPPANVPLDIEALFAEADRAREAGDIARSLAYFERVIATAPQFDPRRGLAAMSVARMTMRSNPARAAQALRATIDGMPTALQENASARLVEAYAKSGQTKNAQNAAQRYLERFPNGRRAEDVRRWTAP